MRHVLVVLLLLVITMTTNCYAFMGGVAQRMTTNAISQNIRHAFRPQLRIRKESVLPQTTLLAMSLDESALLAVTGRRQIHCWDLSAGRERLRRAFKSAVQEVHVAPDGNAALVMTAQEIMLWDMVQNKIAFEVPTDHLVVSGFIDADRIALIEQDGSITLFDRSGNKVGYTQLPVSRIEAAAVSFHGIMVADQNSMFLFDNATFAMTHRTALTHKVMSVRCNMNVAVALTTNELLVVNRETKQETRIPISKEGDTLFLGKSSKALVRTVDNTLLTADLTARTCLALPEAMKATAAVMDENGQHVLGATSKGTITLWSLGSNMRLATLVSTKNGWAVVDSTYRYDGNQKAISDLQWQDSQHTLEVKQVCSKYEPALFSRVLETRSVALDSEGEELMLPPQLTGSVTHGGDNVIFSVHAEQVGSSGVKGIRVYRNNRVIHKVEYDDARTSASFDVSIPVKEQAVNLVSAVSWNKDGTESMKRSWDVRNDAAQAVLKAGTTYVLAVGINDYSLQKLQLKNAVADAHSIVSVLSHPQVRLGKTRLKTIYNHEATRLEILTRLHELSRTSPVDNVVIYLSGHGLVVDKTWYFLPSNLAELTKESVKHVGISVAEIERAVAAIPADQVLLVIDACQSGGVLAPIERFRGVKTIRSLARATGVHVITATDGVQEAAEATKLGHGLFTYTLLAGLDGYADYSKNNKVSSDELITFVTEMLPYFSKKIANYTQYPMAYSDGVSFEIVKTP